MLKDISFLKLQDDGSMDYSFDPNSPVATGNRRLTEQIVKRLLTSLGSNVHNPNVGSRVMDIISKNQDDEEVTQYLPIYLNNITSQIKTIQSTQNLKDSETLENITIKSLYFDQVFGGWVLALTIETKNNRFNINI